MLVVEVSRFGGPEVLAARQAPDPVAGPGQVVVRTTAADVLFVDTAIRAGRGVAFFPIRPPYIPGNGVAGRVIALGDGVDPDWAGQAVAAHTGERGGSGGYVEQVAVAARRRDIAVNGIGDYVPAVFRQRATAAMAEAAAGRIRPVIGQVFPLARASDAHAALEARTAVAKALLLT
jgi:NADPH:quinone reductase